MTDRNRKQDAAEEWLAKRDRQYKTRKRDWQTPSTDALERMNSQHVADTSELTPILNVDGREVFIEGSRELRVDAVVGSGNYRRLPSAGSNK